MRTLTDTLNAEQKELSLTPRPRITLSKSGESDIVLEYDRIKQIPSHEEREDSQTLQVICDNSDGYFTSLALQGWDAVLEWGLVTSAGTEYSACAPLKVMSQSLSSNPAALLCYLSMTGIPNQLEDDKASVKYNHHKSDTKTVKDLITEIMDGQPVDTELTEEQDEFDSYIDLDRTQSDPLDAVGQRLSIPNRWISKVSFKLKKTGSPGGTNVTFRIRDVETNNIFASKDFPIASIGTSASWCEATLTLSGTVTFTSGSDAISGSGTSFTTELSAGDKIKKSSGSTWYTVSAITDDSNLTLSSNVVASDDGADTADATERAINIDKEITYEGNTPIGGVWIYCEHTDGDASNYVSISYNSFALKSGEWGLYVHTSAGADDLGHTNEDCAYRYKYIDDGIDCFDHCTSYDVVYDSEDSLIDSYLPKDAFQIQKNDNRLSVVNRLLAFTSCVKRFEADGKMHVFTPTTSGDSYDYEYSLDTDDHQFFSKSQRETLVIPNRYVVSSYEDDDDQYSGEATSAASYALLPKSEFVSRKLTSNAQATSIAEALITQAERAASTGSASVPLNVGAEVWDYVKITDSRQSDSRTGNLGVIRRTYNPNQNTWRMAFSFGKGGRKPVPGFMPSAIEEVVAEGMTDASVIRYGWFSDVWWPAAKEYLKQLVWYGFTDEKDEEHWGIYDIYAFLLKVFPNIEKWLNYYNEVEGSEDVDDTIANALVGYLRQLRDDPDPTLGAHLDMNGYYLRAGTGNNARIVTDTDKNIYFDGPGGRLMNIDTNGNFDTDGGKIINLDDPTNGGDAANKNYVDDQIPFTTMSNPSRSLSVDYQNSSSTKPRMVTVTLELADVDYTTVYIGASTGSYDALYGPANDLGAAGGRWSITFIVPPSYYYKVASDGSIVEWFEWD